VKGFTPTHADAQGRRTDYEAFAKDSSASFPIADLVSRFSDDFSEMDARPGASRPGKHVSVKIPITNTKRKRHPLVASCRRRGIALNVTAMFTLELLGMWSTP